MIPNDLPIVINEKTLKQVFYDYFPKLTYLADETLGEHIASKDIVLEVFQKLWEGRAQLRFSDEKRLAGYLRLLTHNACIDHIRKRNTRKRATLHMARRWNFLQMPEDSVLVTEKEARLQQQTFDSLSAAVERLPIQQRKVMQMDLLEKTSAEIAASLRISEGCVRGYRAKALASLRKMLGVM